MSIRALDASNSSEWTFDANEAIRFARKADAEAVSQAFNNWATNIVVTEHVFIAAAPAPALPEAKPVAWAYETPTGARMHNGERIWENWQWRVSLTKPDAPAGTIRNLTPLPYASPVQVERDAVIEEIDAALTEAWTQDMSLPEALAVIRSLSRTRP
jgi:hypothetical protein